MREYIDRAAGIYLRLMEEADTDLIIAWRNREDVCIDGEFYDIVWMAAIRP